MVRVNCIVLIITDNHMRMHKAYYIIMQPKHRIVSTVIIVVNRSKYDCIAQHYHNADLYVSISLGRYHRRSIAWSRSLLR